MRWQSLSSIRSFVLTASLAIGAAVPLLIADLQLARADDLVEGGDVTADSQMREPGMPSSNPRVKSLLSSHPGELVTICVAGCDGKPQIVQALPKPVEKRVGGMRTTAAGARQPAYDAIDKNSVLCVAGCGGKAAQVVQRLPELPPKPKLAPVPDDRGNEPLDVH